MPRTCVNARIEELPGVRRTWMGPLLRALGLVSRETIAVPSRTAGTSQTALREATGSNPEHGGLAAIRHYLSMEWHMKRLYHRSSVSSGLLSPKASLTLQPNPDFRWVLLWRNNQRHRPPSKC